MTALALVIKYWREIAIGLLVAFLVGAALYIRNAFEERDELKQRQAVLQVQLQDAQANLRLQNSIVEAISQVQIRSSVNVSHIESEAKPVFRSSSDPLPFIAGGVLQAVYSTAQRAVPDPAPGPAPGGDVPAGQPASRVLSR